MATQRTAMKLSCDVAVVGSGPAGLATATQLRQLGVGNVMVLERDVEPGGIPRHCGHPPFGWLEFRRCLTGPQYVSRLVQAAQSAGVDIKVKSTVTGLNPGPILRVSTPDGLAEIRARRVVFATGTRETPRAARMVSGTRPMGVLTTGALQSMVYLKSHVPFRHPVIVGTEWVSYSALLTCRHAGIRPVAMVERRSRPTAWRAAAWFPAVQGIRTLLNTEVASIEGRDCVKGVILQNSAGLDQQVSCDGVLFTGAFVSESALWRQSLLNFNPAFGIPEVDQFSRSSDPTLFAAGNMLHPADSSGRCWREGVATAHHVARSLNNNLPVPDRFAEVHCSSPAIRYVTPQRLVPDANSADELSLQVRFARQAKGKLHLWADDTHVLELDVRVVPEKQMSVPVSKRILLSCPNSITLTFDQST